MRMQGGDAVCPGERPQEGQPCPRLGLGFQPPGLETVSNNTVVQSRWEAASRRSGQGAQGPRALGPSPVGVPTESPPPARLGGVTSGSETPAQGEAALSRDSLGGGWVGCHFV